MPQKTTEEILAARFWALTDELAVIEPEIMAMRELFNAKYAEMEKFYAEQCQPLADAFRKREMETDFGKKKEELATIAKFLRDPVTGISKIPRP